MTKDIRICFVGDSFVNGTGDEEALGWAGRLCADANAGSSSITYYNLGIRRNTSRDILKRFEMECSPRLIEDCDSRVVLSCGVNDTVVENGARRIPYTESLGNVRELLLKAKKYKTILIGPPPVGEDDQNERIMALSQAFGEEASAQVISYIDLFSALITDSAYKRDVMNNDGSHPRSSGYEKIAKVISSSRSWWFHMP